MQTSSLTLVTDFPVDARVRIWRRIFSAPGEFDELQVDAYLIITDHFILCCDTLLCPEDKEILLASVRDELRAGRQLLLFNSHADWDHTWGNGSFVPDPSNPAHAALPPDKLLSQGALIIGHERCAERLLSEANQQFLRSYQQRYVLFQNVTLHPPDITFQQQIVLHGGDLTLHIQHSPGHCVEHSTIWIPELRILLAFDCAEQPFPTIEDPHALRTTLERLQKLHPQIVLCSHGKSVQPQILAQNLAYLRQLEACCRDIRGAEQLTTSTLYPYQQALHDANLTLDSPIDHNFYRDVHQNNLQTVWQHRHRLYTSLPAAPSQTYLDGSSESIEPPSSF
ncbi:MBL fold metallo-hydrolase [Dictyobacter arantiisoli]|uniref:Metallo-beta-lactamase domain-containing protein n=1 Tax=Dictyobacter arantiisoli TaxID=2014874 RepID=A0A5A5THK8_9CHLR|nr:MBL fold metallo-hydrolase [Dictyobacter arantiisoli]GCF11060.1 hypothetical protein KDI_46240 [Dictyobacter arantiisoli]